MMWLLSTAMLSSFLLPHTPVLQASRVKPTALLHALC